MKLPRDLEADLLARGTVGPKANIPEATDEPPPGERGPAGEAGARSPLRLTLPWGPSCNHHWRYTENGVFLSSEGRAFRKAVRDRLWPFARPSFRNRRLAISITLHAPDHRRFDIDNRIKPLLDALQNAGVIDDDEAVDELTCRRGEPRPGGEVEVVLWETGGPDAPPLPPSESGPAATG